MLATLNPVSDFDMEISNLVIILLERVAINMNNSVSSKSQYFAPQKIFCSSCETFFNHEYFAQ